MRPARRATPIACASSLPLYSGREWPGRSRSIAWQDCGKCGPANRVVALDDIFGAEARRLTERLQEAPAWARRFDILDDVIGKRVSTARAPNALAVRASHVLRATRGAASIARLARDLECSQRHLIATFREAIGVTPKTYGRIVRFDHAVKQLRRPDGVRWAEIADASGYYDQAHLIRDFHEFAGLTPSEFLAR